MTPTTLNPPPREVAAPDVGVFLGESEMAQRMREFPWETTSLGPIDKWPQSLKTSVSLMLNSQHPMWIGWVPDNTFLYNDAYLQVLGPAKHPWALGRPAAEVWAEIWDICGPLADKVFQKGEATFVDDVRLFMRRGELLEETYYSFSYSPIRDESEKVGGLFCPSADVTAKNLNARRLATLSELAARALLEKSTAAACASALTTLAQNPDDVPFALLYLVNAAGDRAVLQGAARMTMDCGLAVASCSLNGAEEDVWPVAEAIHTAHPQVIRVDHLAFPFLGAANQALAEAVILPLAAGGDAQPVGALVVGVNPTRRLDAEYRTFFTLVAGQVATAIAHARAAEEERKRSEALAELDRAKTIFFSNVSHELRTPLTLMLGPMEQILAQPEEKLNPENRELTAMAQRSGLRLLKLVNSLLDFSRIEAGRIEAHYVSTDLATFTADLASVFRSAVEKAGLSLSIHCPPLPEFVYVDREMWEKIVLNLLSNALKFTFEGEIKVTLNILEDRVNLCVSDTGVGIPDKELPKVFERFHRVRDMRSRTHEGTGIGLALVKELAALHGGDATVESTEGTGTTFTVSVRRGTEHLPADRIDAHFREAMPVAATPFIEEALRWLPAPEKGSPQSGARPRADGIEKGKRILLADDNSDMREYVCRLLANEYSVEAVSDGQRALECMRENPPDLVLTDVMMPRLDGFALLAQMRADDRLKNIPFVMLSARAGEEARIEGLAAGADDYLIKPFSAKELLAVVSSRLERRRAEDAARVRAERQRILSEALAHLLSTDEPERIVRDLFPKVAAHLGVDVYFNFMVNEQGDALHLHSYAGVPEETARNIQRLEFGQAICGTVAQTRRAIVATHIQASEYEKANLVRNFGIECYACNPLMSGERLLGTLSFASRTRKEFDEDELEFARNISNYVAVAMERVRAERSLREGEARFRQLADVMPQIVWVTRPDGYHEYYNRRWYEYIGCTSEECIGHGWNAPLHPDDRQRAIERWSHALRTGDTYEIEYRFQSKDGNYRWFLGRALPIRDGQGAIVKWFGTCTDIDDQKRAEEALRASMEEANLSRQKAEAASRAKDDFLAALSHELRTPLTPVLMSAAALAADPSLPTEVREDCAMIRRNIDLEARLIDDLLDLTRITRGKLEIRQTTVNVHALLKHTADIIRSDARELGVTIEFRLAAASHHTKADPARLHQVFWNLTKNALKFTEAGGRVVVQTSNPIPGEIAVAVEDTGIGISPDALGSIFRPFEQGDHGGRHRFGGLGLGLSISKAIVDLHGGTLEASSAGHGHGATFTVKLPTDADLNGASLVPVDLGQGAAILSPQIEEEELIRPLRILLVEDHTDTATVLARLLRRMGHHVIRAESVASAFHAAHAEMRSGRIDLVMSDLGLPDGSGTDLMRELSATYHLAGIALSGFGMESDVEQSRAAGFSRHLVKPVDVMALKAAIADLTKAKAS